MKTLRGALIEQLKHPEAPVTALTSLFTDVAREARKRDIQPEQVLVTFKQLWNHLAESLRPQNSDQYERLRQRLVTLFIQAYYAE
jgi:hypothetical protein